MSDIQLQILVGPNKGKQLRLRQQRITFGRAADNTLVIDQEYVSRYHGELTDNEDGELVLINHSPNGTYLEGKLVTKKPRAVRDQDTITIGEQPLFQVRRFASDTAGEAEAPGAEEAEDDDAGQAAPESSSSISRRKLWMGIGVYLACMLGLFVFLAWQFGGSNNNTSASTGPNTLNATEIASEIRNLGPSPDQTAPSAAEAARHLRLARQAKNLVDTQDDALYQAHWHYQHARAYSPNGQLKRAADRRQALEVRDKLIEQVQNKYDQAVTSYRNGNYRRAHRVFSQLQRLYPATGRQRQSAIFENTDQLRSKARQRATS